MALKIDSITPTSINAPAETAVTMSCDVTGIDTSLGTPTIPVGTINNSSFADPTVFLSISGTAPTQGYNYVTIGHKGTYKPADTEVRFKKNQDNALILYWDTIVCAIQGYNDTVTLQIGTYQVFSTTVAINTYYRVVITHLNGNTTLALTNDSDVVICSITRPYVLPQEVAVSYLLIGTNGTTSTAEITYITPFLEKVYTRTLKNVTKGTTLSTASPATVQFSNDNNGDSLQWEVTDAGATVTSNIPVIVQDIKPTSNYGEFAWIF